MKELLPTRQFTIRGTAIVVALVLFSATASARINQNEGEQHDEGPLVLSQAQIEHSGITLLRAQPGSLKDVIRVYGTVKPNPEKSQHVRARFNGQIRSLNKGLGDTVERGDRLLTIEANESLQTYTVTAAIDGMVTERGANAGEQTDGRTLLKIEDLSSVWIELAIFPSDLRDVKVGQAVQIRDRDGILSEQGTIEYMAPAANIQTQSVSARVPLDNSQRVWIPGNFVVGEIILSNVSDSLIIDRRAVQIVDNRQVIFVKEGDGFEPRAITLGRSDEHFSEVLDGLNDGEIYVNQSSFVLKSELGKENAEHGH